MIPPQEYPHGYCTSGVLYEIGNFCGFLINFSFVLEFPHEIMLVFHGFLMATSGVLYEIVILLWFPHRLLIYLFFNHDCTVYLKYPLTFLMVSFMGFQCFHVRFSNDFVMCRGFKQLVSLRVFHRIIPLKNPVTSSK